MKRCCIWAIYSSWEVCKSIRADCVLPREIHLDLTAVKAGPSLKKLFSARNNRACPFEPGDYVIAIDHAPGHVFKIDTEDPRLLHFSSLPAFMAWAKSCEESAAKEALPLIAEKKALISTANR